MSVLTKPGPAKSSSPPRLNGEPFDPLAALVANSGLVRTKRRPRLMAGGIGVLVAGALAGALTISRGSEQRTAIVASTDIGVGDVITSSQLRVVRIARDTAVRSLPANAAAQLINGVAAVPISKGALVLPDQVTVSSAYEAFTETGGLKDEKKTKQLAALARTLVEHVTKLRA